MSKSIGRGPVLFSKAANSRKSSMENNLPYHTLKWLQFSKEKHQIKQQFRSSAANEIVETSVMMTFCPMNASGIYNSKIRELWVFVFVSQDS